MSMRHRSAGLKRASEWSQICDEEVDSNYLSQFDVQVAGGPAHAEYWVPAEQLAEFNQHIIGKIQVLRSSEGTKTDVGPID